MLGDQGGYAVVAHMAAYLELARGASHEDSYATESLEDRFPVAGDGLLKGRVIPRGGLPQVNQKAKRSAMVRNPREVRL
ncbi:MAG: hypothetical protein RMJ98_01460 [Myxococcales bacterium]|nr:hypothetical protein [Polyangiaceae bacterium]MDW8247954.1 hypothetical protein [Myxococcales bacterium]